MFEWKDFISLAEKLLKKRANEARWRTAIDRAYYGAFCTARDKAGFQNHRSGEVHRETAKFYLESKNKEKEFIGKKLNALRHYRNQASYELNLNSNINKNQATLIVLQAQKVIEKLK